MDFSTKYTVKTDMADEILEGLYGKKGKTDDGITFSGSQKGNVHREVVTVDRDFIYGDIKKDKGTYVTVSLDNVKSLSGEDFENAANLISESITELLPSCDGLCLAVCLGNRNLVADAIGPYAAEKIIVSRHIKNYSPDLYEAMEFGECACIETKVMGETGIEAAELVKGAVSTLKPKAVIVIDALTSRRLSRLAKTVQISNTGISPGSGVNNSRSEISSKTLGIPVISVGVPTVVEAKTVCVDILNEIADIDGKTAQMIEKAFNENPTGFFVTPKDADVYVKTMAKLVGFSVNKALHKNMTFSEMEELLS